MDGWMTCALCETLFPPRTCMSHVSCHFLILGRHAYLHHTSTHHRYAIDLCGDSIWNYALDTYVHATTHDAAPDDDATHADGEEDDDMLTMKIQSIAHYYNSCLTQQLQQQYVYYEGERECQDPWDCYTRVLHVHAYVCRACSCSMCVCVCHAIHLCRVVSCHVVLMCCVMLLCVSCLSLFLPDKIAAIEHEMYDTLSHLRTDREQHQVECDTMARTVEQLEREARGMEKSLQQHQHRLATLQVHEMRTVPHHPVHFVATLTCMYVWRVARRLSMTCVSSRVYMPCSARNDVPP